MMRLSGVAVSPGISVGNAQIVLVQEMTVRRVTLPEGPVEPEVARLKRAIEATIADVEALKEQARGKLSEDFLAIFDAHVIILKDPTLFKNAAEQIRADRVNAEFAFQSAIQEMVTGLLATEDPYFQERASDLEDLRRRTLGHLAGGASVPPQWGSGNMILLADTLTPSETSAFHNAPIVGFATEHGARTSHTAIIARSLEIPAVVGVKGLMSAATSSRTVIVDGLQGEVILDPAEAEISEYQLRAEAYRKQRRQILAHARKEARTIDGHRILVSANVDLTEEVRSAIEVGANGVGLYRSEFLFLDCAPDMPSEEQHLAYYNQIAEPFYPHRVVIRTLDLGGEKYFHAVLDKSERNPVLGVRAIRFCLKHPEMFRLQLRGLLRASARRNVAILIPLVTALEELQQTLALLETCKSELAEEGLPFDRNVPVGIMIEVPSAALTAEAFAPFVDFFSIGTNDLIQYLLAIDRNNDSVAHLYDPMHPAVLRCIGHVCEAAAAEGKPVTVCGEVAADPRMTALLLGLGVGELSMTPSSILDIKGRVRNLSLRNCQKLAKKARTAHTGHEVGEMVDRFLTRGERAL